MKRTATAAALLVLILASAAAAHPIPRTVLLETFTNISCAGCAEANPVTAQAMAEHGRHELLNVQYHVNWPHPADPFYLVAPAEIWGRVQAYGFQNVPELFTCGANTPPPGDAAALAAAVSAAYDRLSPLRVVVASQWNGTTQVTATVGVKAVAAPPAGTLKLRVAVVDELETFASPPGNNGETDFHWALRDLAPTDAGTAFTIQTGDSLIFQLPIAVDQAWYDTDLRLVAWVQDDATLEVLQAGSDLPRAGYAAAYYSDRYAAVSPVGELILLEGWLDNLGLLSDTYDIHLEAATPGWSVSACVGSTCYPPWVTDVTATLTPGAEQHIGVNILPSTAGATGEVTVTLTSRGDRTITFDRTFRVITPGAAVLVVDGDPAHPYLPYFTAAVGDAGRTWTAWDRAAYGLPTAADLAWFDVVVWNTGLAVPALPAAERALLETHLDAGGELMLSGQDLAFDLCDPGSPNGGPAAQDWYEAATGASFVADDSYDTSLTGAAGDPVGDGLAFAIAGGDGAGNQDYPDELAAAPNARACLLYAPGRAAAVRFGRDDARVVTLGFGFEGVDTAAHRSALMDRILDWLQDTAVTAPETPATATLALTGAHPNPFNPSTTVGFELGGVEPVAVSLAIHDLEGRHVRDLWTGPLGPGPHAVVWDGRDDRGGQVAGGVYLAVVRTADAADTLKLTLVK
ncbi:MAG: FlgD immunoglobulin-like domain containing protein [Candidatus Latescibacteria bacterium]|nr:FlgD immunoglobulin-like domain containing protein [Candidatus Latescibacterota bacterium]